MKLVVDTNIIAAALLRDSTTRKLLFNPEIVTFTPEHVLAELERHRDVLLPKSGLAENDYDAIFDRTMSEINVVPIDEFQEYLQQAYDAMKEIDETDTPFLALALSFENDGIWSNDAHFDRQTMVNVTKTKDLVARYL